METQHHGTRRLGGHLFVGTRAVGNSGRFLLLLVLTRLVLECVEEETLEIRRNGAR
jgi:hypothetical protein